MDSKQLLLLSLTLFLITFWFYRYYKTVEVLPPHEVETTAQGMVASSPRCYSTYCMFDLTSVQFKQDSEIRARSLTVYAPHHSNLSYGDWVKLEGKLDPKGYIGFPEVEKLKESRNIFVLFRKILSQVRTGIEALIDQTIPEPEAGLLKGILLGVKGGVSPHWADIYRKSGVTHVIVASGYNVMILITVVNVITSPWGGLISCFLSGLVISLFTLMLGADPPILRAALMGFITTWGSLFGRRKHALRVLLFSVFLMVFIQPQFINSISFQLSFATSLGLVLVTNELNRRLNIYPLAFLKLKGDFITTVSAFLFVFPLVSFHFGQVSLASFLVNTLVLWTIPPAMLFGFLTVLTASLSTHIGRLVGAFSWVFLRFFNIVVSFSSKFFDFWQLRISVWGVFLYYIFLLSLCLIYRSRWKKRPKEGS